VFFENHQTTLSLEIPHQRENTYFGGVNKYMNMVGRCMRLDNFNIFVCTKLLVSSLILHGIKSPFGVLAIGVTVISKEILFLLNTSALLNPPAKQVVSCYFSSKV